MDSEARSPEPFVGIDGYATLALSCALIVATGGGTLLAALIHVIRVGLEAVADAGGGARVLVLGYRLRGLDRRICQTDERSQSRLMARATGGGRPSPDARPEVGYDGLVAPTNQTQWVVGTKIYRERLDRALILLRTAPQRESFLLGGRRWATERSEASVGAAYLKAHGIAERRIHQEDRSRHTLENLRQYRAAFPDASVEPIVLVSSRFHLARVAVMARGLSLPFTLCPAETARAATFRRPDWLIAEAMMVHWYAVGRAFSRWTHNHRMQSRIT